MTNIITEGRKLLAEATKGPWHFDRRFQQVRDEGNWPVIDIDGGVIEQEDVALIVFAVNNLEKLLDVVEALGNGIVVVADDSTVCVLCGKEQMTTLPAHESDCPLAALQDKGGDA